MFELPHNAFPSIPPNQEKSKKKKKEVPSSLQAEGETDEAPIVLSGDDVEDFEGLMRILYPP